MTQIDWDLRFLRLAKYIAQWSKDPSTKTGAVIVDDKKRIVSVGYNGFARGVQDLPDRYKNRDLKYLMVCHCETNCVLSAGRSVENCTLYTMPFMSCARCAALMIQAGISRAVAPALPKELEERWGKECEIATMQFNEAGVTLDLYPLAMIEQIS